MTVRCPRCHESQVEPYETPLDASDRSERVLSTHRCVNPACKYHLEAFRYTPPEWERPEVWP